jgi:hypothetical protein
MAMTTIDGLGRVLPSVATAGARVGRDGGFSMPGEAPASASGPSSLAAVSLGDMLILQEVEDDAAHDRAARRHGRAMLAELKALQRALLADSPDPEPLRRLAALAADVPLAADQRLADALEDVSVRAWVELARFGIG